MDCPCLKLEIYLNKIKKWLNDEEVRRLERIKKQENEVKRKEEEEDEMMKNELAMMQEQLELEMDENTPNSW